MYHMTILLLIFFLGLSFCIDKNKGQILGPVEGVSKFNQSSRATRRSEESRCSYDTCSNAFICDEDKCSGCEFSCNSKLCVPPLHGESEHNFDVLPDAYDMRLCPLATFFDITDFMFPRTDKYWYQWKHSGMPYQHQISPLFTDLNGDGVLDYFNSMHGHKMDEHGYNRMELAESVPYNVTFTNNIFPLTILQELFTENASKQDIWRFHQKSYRIIIDDKVISPMDTHGQNIIDLDNDGIIDMMISSGGGRGTSLSEEFVLSRDNFLLWGELGIDEMTGEKTTIFRGGRDAARNAGIHMRHGRGRINYMFDANGDGLIDIFCLQDRRVSNELAPGVLLINQGNRTWREDWSMSEFTRSAILTDADGDGLAQEFVVSRGFCFPQRNGPSTDPKFPELGPFPDVIIEFCATRPVGSTAVYKYNRVSQKMEDNGNIIYRNVSPLNEKQPPCCPHGSWSTVNNCHAKSIATGDFDGDILADHIFLFERKLVFYFSTDRPITGIGIGDPNYIGLELYFPTYCTKAESVRVVDLDNDGHEELLVMCKDPATFLLYTQGKKGKSDWTLNNQCNFKGALGDLVDISIVQPTERNYQDWCFPGNRNSIFMKTSFFENLDDFCLQYPEIINIRPKFFTSGLSMIDLNNDGFLDAVVVYNFGYLKFFRNIPSKRSKSNRFIAFQLIGSVYGIGSTVILFEKRGEKFRTQFREISSYQHTSDKYGYKEDRIIFGLGKTGRPIKVVIRRSNGYEQTKWADKDFKWSTSKPMQVIKIQLSPNSKSNESCTDLSYNTFNFFKTTRPCFWLNALDSKERIILCGQSDGTNAAIICPDVCNGLCSCRDNMQLTFNFSKDLSSCYHLSTLKGVERRTVCKKYSIVRDLCPDTCKGWCYILPQNIALPGMK